MRPLNSKRREGLLLLSTTRAGFPPGQRELYQVPRSVWRRYGETYQPHTQKDPRRRAPCTTPPPRARPLSCTSPAIGAKECGYFVTGLTPFSRPRKLARTAELCSLLLIKRPMTNQNPTLCHPVHIPPGPAELWKYSTALACQPLTAGRQLLPDLMVCNLAPGLEMGIDLLPSL